MADEFINLLNEWADQKEAREKKHTKEMMELMDSGKDSKVEFRKYANCNDILLNSKITKEEDSVLDKIYRQEIKADEGKPEISLVPMEIMRDIAYVRMYGNKKYPKNTWREVEIERYIDAMDRHMLLFNEDPYGLDEESGLPHLWHIACNVAFLCDLMKHSYVI